MMSKRIQSQKRLQNRDVSQKLLFKEHFSELVYRFYCWLFFFIIGIIIGYIYYVPLLNWLILPLGRPLFYTSPVGGFNVVIGISALFGFVFSFPVMFYQIIKFIEPISPNFSGRKIYVYILISFLLAILGILFSYYLVFPEALRILNSFAGNQLQSLISTTDYFPFIIRYLVGFAILFQLPLIIYVVDLFTHIEPKILLSKFKYVIIFSFIIAAILTPTPDFLNQSIMALPIIILYTSSVLILYIKQFIVNYK